MVQPSEQAQAMSSSSPSAPTSNQKIPADIDLIASESHSLALAFFLARIFARSYYVHRIEFPARIFLLRSLKSPVSPNQSNFPTRNQVCICAFSLPVPYPSKFCQSEVHTLRGRRVCLPASPPCRRPGLRQQLCPRRSRMRCRMSR